MAQVILTPSLGLGRADLLIPQSYALATSQLTLVTMEGGGWELRYEGIKIKEGLVPRPWAWAQAHGKWRGDGHGHTPSLLLARRADFLLCRG